MGKKPTTSASTALPETVLTAIDEAERNKDGSIVVVGTFEPGGAFGFARGCKKVRSSSPSRRDVYVGQKQAEKFRLLDGEKVTLLARPPKASERGQSWCALRVLDCVQLQEQREAANVAVLESAAETVATPLTATASYVSAMANRHLEFFMDSTAADPKVVEALSGSTQSSEGLLVLAGVFEQAHTDCGKTIGFAKESRRIGGSSPTRRQVYFAQAQVQRFNFETGDVISVLARPPKAAEESWAVLRVLTWSINGAEGRCTGRDTFSLHSTTPHDRAPEAKVREVTQDQRPTATPGLPPVPVGSPPPPIQPPREPPPGEQPPAASESPPAPEQDAALLARVEGLQRRVAQLEAELAVVRPRDGPLLDPFTGVSCRMYQATAGGYLSLDRPTAIHVTHCQTEVGAQQDVNSEMPGSILWFFGYEVEEGWSPVSGEPPPRTKAEGWFPASCIKRVDP